MDPIVKDGVVYYPRQSLDAAVAALRDLVSASRAGASEMVRKNSGKITQKSCEATGKAFSYEHAASILEQLIFGE